VGDVIRTDTPLDAPSTVFVADRPKFKGRPTRIGNRYAVQITESISKADEPLYMNEVQKTDTGVM
jgi:flagellar motor switch protein FliM